MRLLSVSEIIELHRMVTEHEPAASIIRDVAGLKSAAAQPRLTFGGEDLYPTVFDKAAAVCHSLVLNHPFVDGNKRVGHAALETMLVLNGFILTAGTDEQEDLFLRLAAGQVSRSALAEWVRFNSQAIASGV